MGKKGAIHELNPRTYEITKKYSISTERISDLKNINKNLPIHITDIGLLDVVLTHSSYVELNRESRSYRRLCYLGSFIDSFFRIYNAYSKNNGLITEETLEYIKKFARVSPKQLFCRLFDKLSLKNFIRLSPNTTLNDSIKTDTIQALIAIVFIDSGFDESKNFNLMIWKDLMDMKTDISFDTSTRLQEIVQKTTKNSDFIEYKVLLTKGPDHQKEWKVGCFIEGVQYGEGSGFNKKEARQKAAEFVLNNENFLKKYVIDENQQI